MEAHNNIDSCFFLNLTEYAIITLGFTDSFYFGSVSFFIAELFHISRHSDSYEEIFSINRISATLKNSLNSSFSDGSLQIKVTEHALRLLLDYSWNNVEDENYLSRIKSFTGGLDYLYSGWERQETVIGEIGGTYDWRIPPYLLNIQQLTVRGRQGL